VQDQGQQTTRTQRAETAHLHRSGSGHRCNLQSGGSSARGCVYGGRVQLGRSGVPFFAQFLNSMGDAQPEVEVAAEEVVVPAEGRSSRALSARASGKLLSARPSVQGPPAMRARAWRTWRGA
jgi:hypothetical protein